MLSARSAYGRCRRKTPACLRRLSVMVALLLARMLRADRTPPAMDANHYDLPLSMFR